MGRKKSSLFERGDLNNKKVSISNPAVIKSWFFFLLTEYGDVERVLFSAKKNINFCQNPLQISTIIEKICFLNVHFYVSPKGSRKKVLFF